jgi:predicted DNA-binding transcriptional regulator AlpA
LKRTVAATIQGENSQRQENDSLAPKLLSPKDVAEITGLSVETLAQWRSQGRGPLFVKISRNFVRYRHSDLDGWLAERIVRTDQERLDRR